MCTMLNPAPALDAVDKKPYFEMLQRILALAEMI